VSEPRFAVDRGDASEQVAAEIRRYVLRNDLSPGDRLGTEQELASEFGVSRPTLREGLRMLASAHLVRSARGPGGGIFVAGTAAEGMSRSLSDSIASMLEADGVSLRELVEARIYLEVPIAGLAALRATGETGNELQAAIDDAVGHHGASQPFLAADARFHRILAATAGNELLRGFTSWALDVLQPSLIAAIGGEVDGEAILGQHETILRAVRRRQQRAAERAMRTHLEYLSSVLEAHEGRMAA